MDIGVDYALVYYSFVSLGYDSDEIIEQDDDHEHGLKDPDEPYIRCN